MVFKTILQALAIAVLFFWNSPSIVEGTTEYYVAPTEYSGIPCPGQPCHTLNHYASNIPDYTWSDVVVRFLPGNHSLNQPFYIRNKRNLQLTSFEAAVSVSMGGVSIHCTSEANFHFWQTSNVTIVDLLFVVEPVVSIVSGTLMFNGGINFRIQRVIVQNWERESNCHGHTIHLKNTYGKSIILDSEFHEFKSSGNVGSHILISHSVHGNYLIDNHLIVTNSTFTGAPMSAADITLESSRSVFIEISDSYIISNKGIGIVFAIHNTIATVYITNCLVTQNKGGGLHSDIFQPTHRIQIVITNSTISKNERNTDEGAGMAMILDEKVEKGPVVILKNVSFINNTSYGVQKISSAVLLYMLNNVTFIGCKFHANKGTVICVFSSVFYINGHTSFIDNSATQGGAIVLLENSQVVIMNNTEILFLNNYAQDVGGTIFVLNTFPNDALDRMVDYVRRRCSVWLFSTRDDPFYHSPILNVTLNFTNNTGWNGGDVIYGEDIGICAIHEMSLSSIMVDYNKGTHVYFNPDRNKSLSLLSSDPLRACICTSGRPECTNVFVNLTKYPGEHFSISAVVVGENFGTVTGSVYSNFLPLNENRTAAKLEELQHLQGFHEVLDALNSNIRYCLRM